VDPSFSRLLFPLLLLSPVLSPGDPVWPSPPQAPRLRFVGAFSGPGDLGMGKGGFFGSIRSLLFGDEKRQLVRPYGVAVGDAGRRIFVSDPGLGAVHVFDLRRHRYSQLPDSRRRELRSPIGVAVDAAGRLLVSDAERALVFVFSPSNKLLFSFGQGEGLKRPTGMAVSGDRLLVSDTMGHRVLVYRVRDRGADLLFQFGGRGDGPGLFNFPVDIAVAPDGRIYVNDSMNFRVQVFDAQGRFVRALGRAGDSTGTFQRSKGVALDSDGNLYVVDALSDTVQIFDSQARFVLNFGRPGAANGEFWLPSGLAIDQADRVYVVDSYNRRVQTFQYLKEGGR
jgi:DNA-binding beta-propeller fold protein YncE